MKFIGTVSLRTASGEEHVCHNSVVDEGFCDALTTMFGSRATESHYCGLVTNYISENSYDHFTSISNTTWPQWSASVQNVPYVAQAKNNTAMAFTISGTSVVLEGIVILNSNVIDQAITAYHKWSIALFDTPLVLNTGDVISITYDVTLTCE